MKHLVFIQAIVTVVACACSPGEPPAAPKDTATSSKAEANELVLTEAMRANARIETRPAGPQTISQNVTYQGDIVVGDEHNVSISSQIEGVVKSIERKLGDRVNQGDELVVLKSKKLAEILIEYIDSETSYRFAKEQFAREKELLEKEITSKEAFQQKKHEYEKAEIAHRSAHQRLLALGYKEKSLHRIWKQPKRDLTRHVLRTPISGEVIRRDLTVGENVAGDKELFAIADLSELVIEFAVPIKHVTPINAGMEIVIQSEITGQQVGGEIVYVASLADEATRTVPVKAKFPKSGGKWKPGMCADVTIPLENVGASVAVPTEAVQEIDRKTVLFVERAKGRFELRTVTIGMKDDSFAEINEGIEVGEKVVTEGSLSLKAEWLRR